MKRLLANALLGGVFTIVLTGAATGVANAEPAPSPDDPPAVWLAPGLDGGTLLGPTIPAPSEVLAPLYGVVP
jgi:hypothetical protein